MRALILSCNTGEGHNSCAKAIREAYELHGDYCIIEDSLRFISDSASKVISKGHVALYRHFPAVFGFAYGFSEEHPSFFEEDQLVYKLMSKGTERLSEFIREGVFDVIICTHVFSALMLTSVKNEFGLNAKTCFVATDYTCSPGVCESDLDVYYIPAESLREEFITKNVPKEKIEVSGIPVREMFYHNTDRACAKKKHNVPTQNKHLVIASGSMGCGPIEELTEVLADTVSDMVSVTVVCGTNRKLCNKLKKRFGDCKKLRILGYVKDMSLLMDSADLYLTKPGGISVTEAKLKKLPTVLLRAVAGCEAYNQQFFLELGSAVCGSEVEELAETCVKLIEDDEKLSKMSSAYDKMVRFDSAEFIYQGMRELLAEKQH